ncbi:MAG: hypothetical protein PHW77_02375 [Eubacteriales bacterium]|nr:hypothetical protein [Eubacteriales bacterium]
MACSALCASIILPTSVAVSGAAWNGEHIYAVDGLTPWVFVFENNGLFIQRFRTLRAYRTIRYDFGVGRFAATDRACSNRIYILNTRLEEIGSIELEIQTASDNLVADAGYNQTNTGFDVAHPYALRVYALDGSYDSTVTRNPSGREFLHWADFGVRRALHYFENGRFYVTVDRVGGILPDCVALKAFIPRDDELYGAFGVGYIYTYFIPVYTEGQLNTSIFGNFAFIADNISAGCCN